MRSDVPESGVDDRHEREHVAGVLHLRHPFDEHRVQSLRAQHRRERETGHTGARDDDPQTVVALGIELLLQRGGGEHDSLLAPVSQVPTPRYAGTHAEYG